jgi:hypothetical protein
MRERALLSRVRIREAFRYSAALGGYVDAVTWRNGWIPDVSRDVIGETFSAYSRARRLTRRL